MSTRIGMSFTGTNNNLLVYKQPKIVVSTPRLNFPQQYATTSLKYKSSRTRPLTLGATNLQNMFGPRPKRGCGCGH